MDEECLLTNDEYDEEGGHGKRESSTCQMIVMDIIGVVKVVKNLQVVVGKRATTSAHQAGAQPLKCPHALSESSCKFFEAISPS